VVKKLPKRTNDSNLLQTMQFEDQICVLPAGLDSFYWLSFLSAGILGGSMAIKKYSLSAPLR
jgi:hypothetical protein